MKKLLLTLTIGFFIFVPKAHADGSTVKIICTPVYGMANICEEHITVDTGLESSLFYSLSTFSYLTGLGLFIKAKK